MVADKLKDVENSVRAKYSAVTDRAKSHIESEVRRVIEKLMKQLSRRVRRFSRRKIVDKDMFGCVKDCVDDVFDDLWPELENEIMYSLRLQFDILDEYKKPEAPPYSPLMVIFNKMRAAYRFAIYPCKSLPVSHSVKTTRTYGFRCEVVFTGCLCFSN